jgi:hypothetical protein
MILKPHRAYQISGFPVPYAHTPCIGIALQVRVCAVNVHHDSGASDGKCPVVLQVRDPRWEFGRDDVERGFAIRGTVPKIEEVDANGPICDQVLSC